jgi:hypothetical protein
MINEKQTALYKAAEYVYDLANAAAENGFKPGEHWEVQMATAAEKKALEKQYHPTVTTKMLPELINTAFSLVKAQLNQVIKLQAPTAPDRFAAQPEYEYLLAFNTNRIRR